MDQEKALLAFQKQKNRHLIISVLLDLIGMSSYLLPFLGELGDAIFAPFYGIAIFVMYRRALIPAALGGFTGALEEFLPASDIVPHRYHNVDVLLYCQKEKSIESVCR